MGPKRYWILENRGPLSEGQTMAEDCYWIPQGLLEISIARPGIYLVG